MANVERVIRSPQSGHLTEKGTCPICPASDCKDECMQKEGTGGGHIEGLGHE